MWPMPTAQKGLSIVTVVCKLYFLRGGGRVMSTDITIH